MHAPILFKRGVPLSRGACAFLFAAVALAGAARAEVAVIENQKLHSNRTWETAECH
jgi:hypothetical protein